MPHTIAMHEKRVGMSIKDINVGSDTFGNPIFQKVLHAKLAIILDYKSPWMLCLALQPGQKSGLILVDNCYFKIEVTKKSF